MEGRDGDGSGVEGVSHFTERQVLPGRTMWPGTTLEKASIAMFSIHAQEAVNTASERATTLRLIKGVVVAEQSKPGRMHPLSKPGPAFF
ncbi:hypothetical protein QFZ23_002348 [Arthrobacter globiformis]|uniref:hypothetical protein n=1 Tax=Arthrobacter globiformis TaxID=1665 RepID=UPI00278708A0|nr:hypothetical protein [Arthrobacter globiformis]MDQ1058447.1 hypothetical protein [Arthrobacter globiformis]